VCSVTSVAKINGLALAGGKIKNLITAESTEVAEEKIKNWKLSAFSANSAVKINPP